MLRIKLLVALAVFVPLAIWATSQNARNKTETGRLQLPSATCANALSSTRLSVATDFHSHADSFATSILERFCSPSMLSWRDSIRADSARRLGLIP